MNLLLEEVKEKIIQQYDEVDLIDFLGLTTADIVGAFSQEIEDNLERIIEELE